MKKAAVVVCLALLQLQLSWAQTQDIPPGHWAYEAVKDLAGKGLVLGYPDGNFLGNRNITRYEMATIIKRILDQVEQRMAAGSPSAPTASPASPAVTPAPSVSPEDLAMVKKLVDEYKVELTVIGADLKKVQDELETVKSELATVKETVNEPEGPVQTTISDVAKLKKIRVSGYVQSRYENYEQPEGVVNLGNNNTQDNRFFLRRGRFKITGEPTSNTVGVVQLDVTGYSRSNVESKDVYLEYHPWGNGVGPFFVRFGQFPFPFGYVIERSSSVREVPERPKLFAGTAVSLPTLPSFSGLFPGERDRGIALFSSHASRADWAIGLFNGQGTKSPYLESGGRFEDDDTNKTVIGRFRYPVLENLNLGVSGFVGKQRVNTGGATPTFIGDVNQNRFGADFQLYLTGASLKGEYVTAKEPFVNGGSPSGPLGTTRDVSGWYLTGVKNIGPEYQLVAQYDVLNDAAFDTPTSFGLLTDWNFGVIRFLDNATKVKLFYEINDEERNEVDNDGLRFEVLTVF